MAYTRAQDLRSPIAAGSVNVVADRSRPNWQGSLSVAKPIWDAISHRTHMCLTLWRSRSAVLRWAGDQRSSLERARPGVGSWRATQENVCGGESMGKRQPPLRRCQLCNARRSGLLRPDSTWNRRAELPGPKFDLPAYRHAAALARSTLLRKLPGAAEFSDALLVGLSAGHGSSGAQRRFSGRWGDRHRAVY